MLFMIPWTVAGSPDRKEMHDSRIHETSQEHHGDEILSRSLQIVAAGGFVNRYIRPNIKQILLIRRTDTLSYMKIALQMSSMEASIHFLMQRRRNDTAAVDMSIFCTRLAKNMRR